MACHTFEERRLGHPALGSAQEARIPVVRGNLAVNLQAFVFCDDRLVLLNLGVQSGNAGNQLLQGLLLVGRPVADLVKAGQRLLAALVFEKHTQARVPILLPLKVDLRLNVPTSRCINLVIEPLPELRVKVADEFLPGGLCLRVLAQGTAHFSAWMERERLL